LTLNTPLFTVRKMTADGDDASEDAPNVWKFFVKRMKSPEAMEIKAKISSYVP
jgi:hypothetical protein